MYQDRILTIIKAISEALNSGSRDVAAVLISVISLILLIILMSAILRIKSRSDAKKSALAAYSKLVNKFGLSGAETDLIEELSFALKNPDKKYLLLVNKGTFRNAVHKMEKLRSENKELIESIRIKVGFSSVSKPKSLNSSRSFKPGMPVLLQLSDSTVLPAEINSVSDSVFTVKCSEDHDSISAGRRLKLIICTFAGFILFDLQIGRVRDQYFSANHVDSEKIIKRKVSFRVFIEPEAGLAGDTRKSAVVMLADSGAVLLNPKKRLKTGDDIRIYLVGDKKKLRHVNAEVVRAPVASRKIAVRYTHING